MREPCSIVFHDKRDGTSAFESGLLVEIKVFGVPATNMHSGHAIGYGVVFMQDGRIVITDTDFIKVVVERAAQYRRVVQEIAKLGS